MIYTALETFYLTDEHLTDTPSRKDRIDDATETTLKIYGCDLIQESGILLRIPQAVMALARCYSIVSTARSHHVCLGFDSIKKWDAVLREDIDREEYNLKIKIQDKEGIFSDSKDLSLPMQAIGGWTLIITSKRSDYKIQKDSTLHLIM